MALFAYYWLLICVVVSAQDAQETKTVETAQGPVRGYKNDEIFEFFGIPYATAPTGEHKFKAPLPGPVWMQPLEAVNNNIVCPQTNVSMFSSFQLLMQENCLVANVYMPDTQETNLPVMVLVHGGGYQVGFGAAASPKTLVKSKKIVAVSFNYRLGIHGFLCLGTEGAPGNAGMKDQVALLRWVKKNIANFGGNPDDVTILGGSAGSSAVDLLMLSKMAEGLFNKVVPESGAGVGVWSVQLDPVQLAKDFAKSNKFSNVDNIYAMEEFYKFAPIDVLLPNMAINTDSTMGFVPCVERNIGVETFLEDTPLNILKQGKHKKLPVLYGFANMEGMIRLAEFDQWKDNMNENFSDFLPADLQFNSEEEKAAVARRVKKFYFEDKSIGTETIQAYVDYFSDIMFTYPHLRSTQLQVAAGSDIYLYEYSFYSPPPEELGLPEYVKSLQGATHCAQSMAVYDLAPGLVTEDTSEAYLKIRKTVREMWLNFITSGKPVLEESHLPAWPSVRANSGPYMDIGDEIILKDSLLEERFKFWDNIYEQFYRSPVPPSQSWAKNEL